MPGTLNWYTFHRHVLVLSYTLLGNYKAMSGKNHLPSLMFRQFDTTPLQYCMSVTMMWNDRWNISHHCCFSTVCLPVCAGWDRRKHQSSISLALCGGNPPMTGGFLSQRASNVESVSISWCHHVKKLFQSSISLYHINYIASRVPRYCI